MTIIATHIKDHDAVKGLTLDELMDLMKECRSARNEEQEVIVNDELMIRLHDHYEKVGQFNKQQFQEMYQDFLKELLIIGTPLA